MHAEIWVGLIGGAKIVQYKTGQDGSCFCWGIQVEIWVSPMGLIRRGEKPVAEGERLGYYTADKMPSL